MSRKRNKKFDPALKSRQVEQFKMENKCKGFVLLSVEHSVLPMTFYDYGTKFEPSMRFHEYLSRHTSYWTMTYGALCRDQRGEEYLVMESLSTVERETDKVAAKIAAEGMYRIFDSANSLHRLTCFFAVTPNKADIPEHWLMKVLQSNGHFAEFKSKYEEDAGITR